MLFLTCSKLRLKVTQLRENAEYEFRVCAENEAGLGKCSVPSIPVIIRQPIELPEPPVKIMVSDTTSSSITLKWQKPLNEGGSEIKSYLVESKMDDSEEWKVVSSTVTENTLIDTSVSIGYKYLYRVSACNKGGFSAPTYTPGKLYQTHCNM